MRLGEALVKESVITREQLKIALERQVIFGGRIGTNIVELGILRERELASFLSKFFRIPAADPVLLASVDADIIACISRELAEKYKAVPFKKERNRLHVAMLEPASMKNVDELRFISGFEIIPYVATELRLLYALEKYYGTERDLRYISIFGKEEEQAGPAEANKERLDKVKAEFIGARDRDEIIGILLNESKRISKRAAIFIMKGEKMACWRARGISMENEDLKVLPNSVFSGVLARKNYYRGPLLKIPDNEQLIALLSGTPQDCLLIPIQIRDKVIALMYVDDGNASVLDAGVNYINTLVAMASISFEIVIMRRKILDM